MRQDDAASERVLGERPSSSTLCLLASSFSPLSSSMLFSTAAVVAGAVGALALPRASPAAALEANLAYRSPSLTVRSLAIDLKPINEGLSKRDNYEASWTGNLTFDYSVASGDPRSDSVILWTHAHKADSEWGA